MAKPKLKDNEILDSIQNYEGPMDPFTFKLYLKEINSIAKHNAFSAYHLKGVLYSVYQLEDGTEAIANFEKAIPLVSAENRPRLLANYSKALFHYKKLEQFADIAMQGIDASIRIYGADATFTQDLFYTTLARLLGLCQFVEAKQMVEKYMQTIPSDWYQQDDLVNFVREANDDTLGQELQAQKEIYQQVLSNTPVLGANISVFSEGDCVISLTVDAGIDATLDLTEQAHERMMDSNFLPERFSILLKANHD